MELEDLTNPSPSVDTKISARLPVCVHFTGSCHYCKIGNLYQFVQFYAKQDQKISEATANRIVHKTGAITYKRSAKKTLKGAHIIINH